eukprot:Lithocolla_globosa_v1_NODE_1758_length_2360_cov_4.501518.p4 type:complete len:106 gc:universal NODE_1758_length_2360_cov_4.501518:331-14(-)
MKLVWDDVVQRDVQHWWMNMAELFNTLIVIILCSEDMLHTVTHIPEFGCVGFTHVARVIACRFLYSHDGGDELHVARQIVAYLDSATTTNDVTFCNGVVDFGEKF